MAELTLLYVPNDTLGYGRMGVLLHPALTAQGVKVYTHHGQAPCPDDRTEKRTNVVCWASTPPHAEGVWRGQHNAIFTMFETTHIPESFRENLHCFDTIIVPSDQNLELFSQYHPNVKRVLLGVDPAQWFYTPRKPPGLFFDFLIGGSGPRKGLDIAWDAFMAAFPEGSWDGPIPRLVMKSPRGGSWDASETREARDFHHPRVEIIPGKITGEEEIALYARSHCYVQPSRGEGFGLQPLQALAQGLPTILTDAHGHESFAHLGYGIPTTLTQSDYFIFGDAGEWWEPNLDSTVDLMRHVYSNYDAAQEKARHAAQVICRHFTWRNTAEQFIAAFDGELSDPYDPARTDVWSSKGDDEWVPTERQLFRIVMAKSLATDIIGICRTYRAGETYWDTADVKRILFDRGALDPVCINDDQTLPPGEVERRGLANDFCPECKQRYGSGLSKTDWELERMAS